MDNRFLSKRILFAYAIALSLGTHFVSTGIDRVFDILVHVSLHYPGAYLGSAVCVLAGFVLIGCGRGLYQLYIHAIEDQMHEAHCTIRELHELPHICDNYVGITLVLLIMVGTLGYRFFHLFDSEIVLVTHDPFKLFFGPAVLGVYGLYLVYRSNKGRKSIRSKEDKTVISFILKNTK